MTLPESKEDIEAYVEELELDRMRLVRTLLRYHPNFLETDYCTEYLKNHATLLTQLGKPDTPDIIDLGKPQHVDTQRLSNLLTAAQTILKGA